MAGVHGERLYGYIDRVPGLCYVATQFFHFNFVPIFPLGTYLVLDSANAPPAMQHRCIGMNLKSVLIGYFRGWVGLATIILFAICAIQSLEAIVDTRPGDGLHALAIAVAALGYAAVWWAMIASHRSWIVAWFLVLAATGGYFAWDDANPPPPKPDNPFKAPAVRGHKHREDLPTYFLFALTVLRTFDRAGRGRAFELGELLGVDEDGIRELLDGAPKVDAEPPDGY
jgi:hypothetical protein